ncbi:hypothetical protein Pla52n_62990 [Stieleria varia]|uniref:Uncharacterized protein n=1 Tax=Stieleria varia TaxID=2528005 RepID=A0A5C5ZZ80_9BACT|nr:hypothetical protein Pla52n_62990 [Stieleria varia]
MVSRTIIPSLQKTNHAYQENGTAQDREHVSLQQMSFGNTRHQWLRLRRLHHRIPLLWPTTGECYRTASRENLIGVVLDLQRCVIDVSKAISLADWLSNWLTIIHYGLRDRPKG